MSGSMDDGLAWIERIEHAGELDRYHLLHAAKADLLRRADRIGEARTHYRKAIELATNSSERRYLERRVAELSADAH